MHAAKAAALRHELESVRGEEQKLRRVLARSLEEKKVCMGSGGPGAPVREHCAMHERERDSICADEDCPHHVAPCRTRP